MDSMSAHVTVPFEAHGGIENVASEAGTVAGFGMSQPRVEQALLLVGLALHTFELVPCLRPLNRSLVGHVHLTALHRAISGIFSRKLWEQEDEELLLTVLDAMTEHTYEYDLPSWRGDIFGGLHTPVNVMVERGFFKALTVLLSPAWAERVNLGRMAHAFGKIAGTVPSMTASLLADKRLRTSDLVSEALVQAARAGTTECLPELLKGKRKLEGAWWALECAIGCGHIKVVHALLADSRVRPGRDGYTGGGAVYNAASTELKEAMDALLLQPGVVRDDHILYALEEGVRRSDAAAVRFLLSYPRTVVRESTLLECLIRVRFPKGQGEAERTAAWEHSKEISKLLLRDARSTAADQGMARRRAELLESMPTEFVEALAAAPQTTHEQATGTAPAAADRSRRKPEDSDDDGDDEDEDEDSDDGCREHRPPGRAPEAGPQPLGWDWEWDTVLSCDYVACEKGWGLTEPYDEYCDDIGGLQRSEPKKVAAKLRALAKERLVWTPLATAEGEPVPHHEFATYRIRWAWSAAEGALRVEAALMLEGSRAHGGLGMTGVTHPYGFHIIVRDSRPPAGPFIAALMNHGCHPSVITSRWRVENSDGSTNDELFDGTEWTDIQVTWEPPHVPPTMRLDEPTILRRAAKGIVENVLYGAH